jgi:hypothetical protein
MGIHTWTSKLRAKLVDNPSTAEARTNSTVDHAIAPDPHTISTEGHAIASDPHTKSPQRCKFLCRRHTVPNSPSDGHTNKEMFKFGSDRNNIVPFVRASIAIVWSPAEYYKLRQQLRERFQNLWHAKNCPQTLRRFIFVLNSYVNFALRKAVVKPSCQIV